jgi:PAS domain S-box-containing protein
MSGTLALRSKEGLLGIITNEFAGGLTARRLIPIAIILPVLFGYLRLEAEHVGILSSSASGVAFLTITIIFTFLVFILLNASVINRMDRKRNEAEEELKRVSDHIQNLYDNAPCGYHSVNKDGYIIEANSTLLGWLGYTREEFIGKKKIVDLYSDKHGETLEKDFKEFQYTGSVSDVEMELRRKDGSTIPVMLNSAAIKDESGNFIQSNTNTFDITRRKKAEQKFITLLDTAPDAMVIVNEEGEIQLINRQTEKLFGYERDELVGRKVEILIPGEFRTRHEAHRKDYNKNLSVRPMHIGLELLGLKKDGTRFPVEISLSPLETAENTLVSASIRDITERKKAEKMLLELNHKLGESNKELESFSYSVSHDLRAPLRHISGFSEKLENVSKNLDSEQKRLLKKISKSAEKMGELIDDLLMFSRMGRTELNRANIDTGRLVNEIIGLQKLTIYNRKVRINVNKLPPVNADRTQIKRVFENLISNAIKYSSKKTNAEIEIGCNGQNGDEHIFFVKDNGAGFDMNYKDKLFAVFQRLHNDSDYEGTGIGLATVKRIVTRHGGKVWAEGKINEGATFYFSLPKKSEEGGQYE